MNANSKNGKQDRKQQDQGPQGSSQQQQDQGGQGRQYGEGNYKAVEDFSRGLKDHVENHDIEREAREAAPRSASEEKEMEEAECYAKSKARGEGAEEK